MGEGRSSFGQRGIATRDSARLLSSFLIVFGLWSFALAQPVFDVLGSATSFFVAHRADGWDLLLFAAMVTLALPLFFAALSALTRAMSPLADDVLTGIVHALLGALIAAGPLREWSAPPSVVSGVALSIGAVGALLLARSARARQLASWIGAASAVFPLLFLIHSPARKIWLDESRAAVVSSSGEHARHSVVLVLFDELPLTTLLGANEQIDDGRFPNFAALAATSDWYRNATTVAQTTTYAVPAMLAGRYPPARMILHPVVSDYEVNLFTSVGATMKVTAQERITSLCPDDLCASVGPRYERTTRVASLLLDASAVYLHEVTPLGWRDTLPEIDATWQGFWDADRSWATDDTDASSSSDRLTPEFRAFLSSLDSGPEPALHYLHSIHPHTPWYFLPNGQMYISGGLRPHGLTSGVWRRSRWEMVQAQQRHLLTTGYVDLLLGRLRERLEALGRWDDSLVVVTSDHGSAFTWNAPRRKLTPRLKNIVEIANVPLFIKWPGQEVGRVDDSNVELVDVFPTLLDSLGLELPEGLDGRSLMRETTRRGRKRIYQSGASKRSPAGHLIEYDVSALSDRRRVVGEKIDRFGEGSWGPVYRATPDSGRGEWIGMPIVHLPRDLTGDGGGPSFGLERKGYLHQVDPEADILPIHLQGWLNQPIWRPARELVLSLNGHVWGVTQSFVEKGKVRFSSLLPPESLKAGLNDVEVFEVVEVEGEAKLRRLAQERPGD
jgi:hypothetical protein